MQIEVPDNPNCAGCDLTVFETMGPSRRIEGIIVSVDGADAVCDVTGVEEDFRLVPAEAVPVADSGEGRAFLIRGGGWGIRLRPREGAAPWDLKDKRQWGETYKVYASAGDILFHDRQSA